MKILLAAWSEGIRGEWLCYSLRISIIFAFWRLFLRVLRQIELREEECMVYKPGTGKSLVVFRILSNCFPYIFLFSSSGLFGQTVNKDVCAILPCRVIRLLYKINWASNGQKCAQGEKIHRFLYWPNRGPNTYKMAPYSAMLYDNMRKTIISDL